MARGERNIKKIESYITDELRRIAPEYADQCSVISRPIKHQNSARDPDYYSLCLVSKEDPESGMEVMQLPPNVLNRKAEIMKGTIAYSRLELNIPKAIEHIQMESQEKTGKNKKQTGGLEGFIPVISGIGILGAIFFLSVNITGNAIANLTTKTSSIIGAGLFVLGIVGSYFWFRKK